MADATQFDHDRPGHMLADHLLEVPRFQRGYAWDETNVKEFLTDLRSAREKNLDYFIGTVVLTRPDENTDRHSIVDGQQRLATTAILLTAIRDLLSEYGKSDQADGLDKRYLRGYDLLAEENVERLTLSPKDSKAMDELLSGNEATDATHKVSLAYATCLKHLRELAPSESHYSALMEVISQLESRVQVLVAVAGSPAEAYVIFETLNDRGADLTTADLLKNYLFSQSGASWRVIEDGWVALEAKFPNPEILVKFIRHDWAARHGYVNMRNLYRRIQEKIRTTAGAKQYMQELLKSAEIYQALRDPSSEFWNEVSDDFSDAMHAYKRLGFESSFPVALAAFNKWDDEKARRLFIKLAKWSVRAQISGLLGAGQAEEAFGETAKAIYTEDITNQTGVRQSLSRIMPSSSQFETDFMAMGLLSKSKAKYLLAMLEREEEKRLNLAPISFDWVGVGVTIEHIVPESQISGNADRRVQINSIGNLTLLEKKYNKEAGSKPLAEKTKVYEKSSFALTRAMIKDPEWGYDQIQTRIRE